MESKYKMPIYILIFIFINLSAIGYPITNSEGLNKDEKRYPNGTVIGKYTYTDDDGNPIHVKYYADDASYGVELKSIKVLNSNSNLQPTELSRYPTQITDNSFELVLDPFTAFKKFTDLNKNASYNLLQIHEDDKKYSNKDKLKHNGEYDIFFENELRVPEKCGKEKVKIYLEKYKRKSRNSAKHAVLKYCI